MSLIAYSTRPRIETTIGPKKDEDAFEGDPQGFDIDVPCTPSCCPERLSLMKSESGASCGSGIVSLCMMVVDSISTVHQSANG